MTHQPQTKHRGRETEHTPGGRLPREVTCSLLHGSHRAERCGRLLGSAPARCMVPCPRPHSGVCGAGQGPPLAPTICPRVWLPTRAGESWRSSRQSLGSPSNAELSSRLRAGSPLTLPHRILEGALIPDSFTFSVSPNWDWSHSLANWGDIDRQQVKLQFGRKKSRTSLLSNPCQLIKNKFIPACCSLEPDNFRFGLLPHSSLLPGTAAWACAHHEAPLPQGWSSLSKIRASTGVGSFWERFREQPTQDRAHPSGCECSTGQQ